MPTATTTSRAPSDAGECVALEREQLFCPVTIGENSVIGSSAVVTSDMPLDVFAVGNPARIVRSIQLQLYHFDVRGTQRGHLLRSGRWIGPTCNGKLHCR